MEIMTPEDRVERAWSKLAFGPGWEDRLSALMAEEIKDAVAQAASLLRDSGPACGFCEGEGEYLVHLALDSAENIYETCLVCKGGGRAQHERLIEHVIEHIKNWASQNQDGLSARQVAEAVVRMCNDAIAELEALATLTDKVWNAPMERENQNG